MARAIISTSSVDIVTLAERPCRHAFCDARALPAGVLGPVLDWALQALLVDFRALVILLRQEPVLRFEVLRLATR